MKSQYALNESQIESLAAKRTVSIVTVDQLDGTYLRALITGVQSKLGPKKGRTPSDEAQLAALETIAVPFYAAVLRGVTTPDIALEANMEHALVVVRNRERNRRATFARSAKSTLVAWIEAGGDVRAIDVNTVTKTELRQSTLAASSDDRGLAPESRIERATKTILATVAREGPDLARAHLESAIEALQEALEALPAEAAHEESTVIRTRVGTPTFRDQPRQLHRGAE